ncbi:MAG: NUDIX domain-containing protein, partial [Deltaproteobacteria bacterium]|nr:NUDIX domain-containing protein [Deltaproteobacteria bacterium]
MAKIMGGHLVGKYLKEVENIDIVFGISGGHIEPDETPIEAVIRETREEAGLDISPYLPVEKLDKRVTSTPTPAYFFEETIPR